MIAFCLKILFCFALGCALSGVVQTQKETVGSQQDKPKVEYQLELVQAVWRHGNRTPTVNYPTPVKEYINSTAPFEFGLLTPDGRRASLGMGQFLRERYAKFLPPYFTYNSTQVTCTAVKRTQETAWVGMSGMWPPTGPQLWQDQGLGTLWTPIPCDYLPTLQDKVWVPYAFCPRLTELVIGAISSPKFRAELEKITILGAVNQYVATNEQLASVNNIELAAIYDYFLSMASSGYPLPDWVDRVYPNPMEEVYGKYINTFCFNEETSKLTVGEFWKDTMNLATTLENGTLTPPNRIFLGYSVHDVNLACLLISLNLLPKGKPVVPTYTSALLIEWYRAKSNSSQIGAKFVYRNDTLGSAVTLTIPGCDEICPLNKIREALTRIIPRTNNREVYCQPLQPLVLADFGKYFEITKTWLPPEFIPEYKELVRKYLNGEKIDLTRHVHTGVSR